VKLSLFSDPATYCWSSTCLRSELVYWRPSI